MIRQITCWETEDGQMFRAQGMAEFHDKQLRDARFANELLEQDKSIAECLRAIDYVGEIDPVLERVTQKTKMVISHWQCSDNAGYSPQYFLSNLTLFVHGDAGVWSGSYGSNVKLADLVRYAKITGTTFEEVKESQ